MRKITDDTKKKVVKLHIQEGRTIASLAAEYGVCNATISNWIHAYREECQTNDAAKSEYELMQEVYKLQQELAEAKKENDFLKKAAAFFAKEID
jgi:transposase